MDKHSPSPPLACLSSTSKSVATVGRAFLPLNVAHLVKQVWDFVSILGKSLVEYFQKAIAKAHQKIPFVSLCSQGLKAVPIYSVRMGFQDLALWSQKMVYGYAKV